MHKKFLKGMVCLCVAAALALLWPGLQHLLPGEGPRTVLVTQLTHELKELGILTSLRYTDTGSFTASVPAVLIGEAQRVVVPYEYVIEYGVDLEGATVQSVDDGLLRVLLPPAGLVHDVLRVTGDPAVYDFFYPLTEARYHAILNDQWLAFREGYLADPAHAQTAMSAAQKRVRTLLESVLDAQGLRDAWSIVFADTAI